MSSLSCPRRHEPSRSLARLSTNSSLMNSPYLSTDACPQCYHATQRSSSCRAHRKHTQLPQRSLSIDSLGPFTCPHHYNHYSYTQQRGQLRTSGEFHGYASTGPSMFSDTPPSTRASTLHTKDEEDDVIEDNGHHHDTPLPPPSNEKLIWWDDSQLAMELAEDDVDLSVNTQLKTKLTRKLTSIFTPPLLPPSPKSSRFARSVKKLAQLVQPAQQ